PTVTSSVAAPAADANEGICATASFGAMALPARGFAPPASAWVPPAPASGEVLEDSWRSVRTASRRRKLVGQPSRRIETVPTSEVPPSPAYALPLSSFTL